MAVIKKESNIVGGQFKVGQGLHRKCVNDRGQGQAVTLTYTSHLLAHPSKALDKSRLRSLDFVYLTDVFSSCHTGKNTGFFKKVLILMFSFLNVVMFKDCEFKTAGSRLQFTYATIGSCRI